MQPDGYDLKSYFGGSRMPAYTLVHKIFMKDRGSVTAIRKAQTAFYDSSKDYVNVHESLIVFGIEGLIMDIGNNIRVRFPAFYLMVLD